MAVDLSLVYDMLQPVVTDLLSFCRTADFARRWGSACPRGDVPEAGPYFRLVPKRGQRPADWTDATGSHRRAGPPAWQRCCSATRPGQVRDPVAVKLDICRMIDIARVGRSLRWDESRRSLPLFKGMSVRFTVPASGGFASGIYVRKSLYNHTLTESGPLIAW